MNVRGGHILAATLPLFVLAACAGSSDAEGQVPATSTTASSVPGATATPFPFSATPVGIEPGTYRIASSAWSVVDYSVSFPTGWAVQYGHVYMKHPDTTDELGFYAVLVDSIYADACAGSNGALVTVGPSVDDLAEALLKQRGPLATGPVDTMIGGYPAKRIDLAVPEGFDLGACNLQDVGLQIWYAADADKYFVLLPGTTMSVSIVDVGGRRQVVLSGGYATSDDDERELQTILDSIRLGSSAHRLPGAGGVVRGATRTGGLAEITR